MDYEKFPVVRDTERKCSYITLREQVLRITDNGAMQEIDALPPLDPPNTPLREKRVFQLQPWPYTGINVPPYAVLRLIEEVFQGNEEHKSA